jgi:DNA repair protein RecO (recombination protein O)
VRQLVTPALVLHAFDYRETSKIVRLATRDAGVVSAIARGARRPRSRFGHGLDLFTDGVAHLRLSPSRDLHALIAFDEARARADLATSLARFTAASALAELCLRFGRDGEGDQLYDTASEALDGIARAPAGEAAAAGLAGAWRLVAELGFAPSLDACASCHAPLADRADVTFHHRAGGALCGSCARTAEGGRRVPAAERRTLAAWLGGDDRRVADPKTIRAHQRLLREFLEEHLSDGRALRAFEAWEAYVASPGSHRPLASRLAPHASRPSASA